MLMDRLKVPSRWRSRSVATAMHCTLLGHEPPSTSLPNRYIAAYLGVTDRRLDTDHRWYMQDVRAHCVWPRVRLRARMCVCIYVSLRK